MHHRIHRAHRIHTAALLVLLAALPAAGQVDRLTGRPEYADRLDLPVASDSIVTPQSVTADPHTGEVFVCDLARDRIVIFGPDGAFRYQITGGDVFRAPRDVAVDPEGYLYVAANVDGKSGLIKLDYDGKPIVRFALSGLPEDADEPRFRSLALSPSGDRLYLLDEVNKRLWIAATADGELGRVETSIDLAEGLEERARRDLVPGHVDVYGERVLVSLATVGEIHLWTLDGTPAGHVGYHGTAPCQVGFPVAAALEASGDYLVLDQQRMVMLRWSPVGNRCTGEYYGLGGNPGYFYFPLDLALGPNGRVYASQGYQGRVQVYQGPSPAAMPEEDAPAEAGAGEPGGQR